MERVGIVDLGSNTARLVVYGYKPGRWFRLLDEIREPLRLADGAVEGPVLSEAAIERAVDALRLYADYARATDLGTLQVIATSAVRDAENRARFLERIRGLDLQLTIATGEQEARLGCDAVANSGMWPDAWVVDVGGGSMQLSRMRDRDSGDGRSFPLGAVRLTRTFLASDPPRGTELAALERHVVDTIGPALDAMRADSVPVVAMGGTARNLARAVQRSEEYPINLLHGYFLELGALESLLGHLACLRARKRERVPGIHPGRADVIVAGAVVLREIVRRAERSGLWISGQGIREGAFYRRFLPAPHRVHSVRRFGVKNLARRHQQPQRHVDRVAKLSDRLFEGLRPLHGLDERDRELLWAGAELHDIGKTVSHYDHEHHGAYLVESTPLPGHDHREQSLVALLVRYHRKGTPKLGAFKSVAARDDRQRLLVLATCLRLAEKLERSRAGRVVDLETRIEPDRVTLRLRATESPDVELWEAGKQAPLFEETFGRKLELEPVAAGAGPHTSRAVVTEID